MQNEAFDVYNAFAKTAFDTGRQIFDMNTRSYEKLVKIQIELASDFMESAVKQGVSHYMAAQKELAQEYADRAQKASQDTVKIITQAQDQVNSYLEEQLPASFDKIKSAAKDTTKEAADTTRSTASSKKAA